MDKQQIRKMISLRKKQMDIREINTLSDLLTDLFLNLPEYKEAEILFAYNAFNQEVRTDRIIMQALSDNKKVAVPRVEGEDLEFRFIDTVQSCTPGCLGIMEPMDHHDIASFQDGISLMLMPGLAFDPYGNRVGYGKGMYDRYISRKDAYELKRIALCYDFQLLDQIASDPFDFSVSKIICAPSGKIIDIPA